MDVDRLGTSFRRFMATLVVIGAALTAIWLATIVDELVLAAAIGFVELSLGFALGIMAFTLSYGLVTLVLSMAMERVGWVESFLSRGHEKLWGYIPEEHQVLIRRLGSPVIVIALALGAGLFAPAGYKGLLGLGGKRLHALSFSGGACFGLLWFSIYGSLWSTIDVPWQFS